MEKEFARIDEICKKYNVPYDAIEEKPFAKWYIGDNYLNPFLQGGYKTIEEKLLG